MPPLRFLHAAGLDPDAVLPRLPASPEDVFEAAPLTAIERLIDEAIAHEVDFLLVSPDVAPKPLSFRSLLALRRAFARLLPHEIPVFVAVGDEHSAWKQLVDRDSTVTILAAGDSAPVTDRNGHARASLRYVSRLSEPEGDRPSPRQGVHELLIAPASSVEDLDDPQSQRHRYWGFGAGPRRSRPLATGLAHSPGAIQAQTCSDGGPHGATLVTIDDGDEVRTEFVPLAAVRYESLAARTKPGESLDDLALRLSERLAEQRAEAGEQAWNVRWSIEAGGELFDTLFDPAQRGLLVGLLPDSVGDVPIVHRLVVVPHPLWPAVDEPFAAEFAAALIDQENDLAESATRGSHLPLPADPVHRQRFELLLAETDVASVTAQARRLGLRVVAAAREADGGS